MKPEVKERLLAEAKQNIQQLLANEEEEFDLANGPKLGKDKIRRFTHNLYHYRMALSALTNIT